MSDNNFASIGASIIVWLIIVYFSTGITTALVALFRQWYMGVAITLDDIRMGMIVIFGGFIIPIRIAWLTLVDWLSKRKQPIGEFVIFKGRKSARVLNELKNQDW